MDKIERTIRIAYRRYMLEMRDELTGLEVGSWARVLLKIRIAEFLQNLGGMAGEW